MLCCAMTMAVMTACSNNDDNPAGPDSPTEQTEYAILLYGFGGRNLDIGIFGNIMDFYKAKPESYGKVQIACQYKYSSAEDLQKYWFDMLGEKLSDEATNAIKDMGLQTVRFVVDNTVQSPDENVLLNHQNIYGPKNNYVANADSLTNFINWATKACPAKHYILIVSDHGGGYQPHDDLPYNAPSQTRGVLYDQNHEPNQHFTVSSLKYAIGRANAHMDVVYLDACLMNMIEVLYELRDVTDYIIASTFTVPGVGGDFSAIINELAKGNPMETALANICKANGDFWAEQYAAIGKRENANFDQSVIRTSAIESYAAKIKDFTNRLVDAYTNGGDEVRKKIDLCTANAMKVESNEPFYELHAYMALIVTGLPEYFPDGYFEDIRDSFLQTCIVNRFSSPNLEKYGFQIGVSTLLAHEGIHEAYAWIRDFDGTWRTYGYTVYYPDGKQVDVDDGVSVESTWGGTFADTYQQLDYDRATGWSRWLLLNKQRPAPFCYLSAEIEPTDIIEDVPF